MAGEPDATIKLPSGDVSHPDMLSCTHEPYLLYPDRLPSTIGHPAPPAYAPNSRTATHLPIPGPTTCHTAQPPYAPLPPALPGPGPPPSTPSSPPLPPLLR